MDKFKFYCSYLYQSIFQKKIIANLKCVWWFQTTIFRKNSNEEKIKRTIWMIGLVFVVSIKNSLCQKPFMIYEFKTFDSKSIHRLLSFLDQSMHLRMTNDQKAIKSYFCFYFSGFSSRSPHDFDQLMEQFDYQSQIIFKSIKNLWHIFGLLYPAYY